MFFAASPPPVDRYPRVSFLAVIAAPVTSNPAAQLQAIQNDMRSNLTAFFSPIQISVAFRVIQGTGRRRLLAAGGKGQLDPSKGQETPCWHPPGAHGVGEENRKPQTGDHWSNQAQPAAERAVEVGDSDSVASARRKLLQSSNVSLAVNVTFPSSTQSPQSQTIANAFNQALVANPSSVLGGFEQGWGTAGVAAVALTYVSQSDSGFVTPAPPPLAATLPSSNGSVGTFVGIAVAAVLGCTALAGLTPTQLLRPLFQ